MATQRGSRVMAAPFAIFLWFFRFGKQWISRGESVSQAGEVGVHFPLVA